MIPLSVIIPVGLVYILLRTKIFKFKSGMPKAIIAAILFYLLVGFIFFLSASQNKPFTFSNLIEAIIIWPLVALYYIVGLLGVSVSR